MFTATHTLSDTRLMALYRELGLAYANVACQTARYRAERQLSFYQREIDRRGLWGVL